MATKDRFNLPQAAKRSMMRALVQIGAAVQDQNSKQQYWSETLLPLQQRFKQYIDNDNFRLSYHQEEIRLGIIDILESFIGKNIFIDLFMCLIFFLNSFDIVAMLLFC